MTALQVVLLLLVAVSGAGVVFTREPVCQAVGLSFYGVVLALAFFVLQAPDVALSQIVVGAVLLPLMILLALARMARNEERRR